MAAATGEPDADMTTPEVSTFIPTAPAEWIFNDVAY
jgi:hypothetical protein